MTPENSNWLPVAKAKARRLDGASEAARQSVIAANEVAGDIWRRIQHLENHRDELRLVANPSELLSRQIKEAVIEIDALTIELAEARQYAGEVSAQAAVIQGIAERTRKAIKAVQELALSKSMEVQ